MQGWLRAAQLSSSLLVRSLSILPSALALLLSRSLISSENMYLTRVEKVLEGEDRGSGGGDDNASSAKKGRKVATLECAAMRITEMVMR